MELLTQGSPALLVHSSSAYPFLALFRALSGLLSSSWEEQHQDLTRPPLVLHPCLK